MVFFSFTDERSKAYRVLFSPKPYICWQTDAALKPVFSISPNVQFTKLCYLRTKESCRQEHASRQIHPPKRTWYRGGVRQGTSHLSVTYHTNMVIEFTILAPNTFPSPGFLTSALSSPWLSDFLLVMCVTFICRMLHSIPEVYRLDGSQQCLPP